MSRSTRGSSSCGAIPDRWLHCPRKSVNIIANKFLAFKTPLDHKFDSQIGLGYTWNPSMVFDSTKNNHKERIGLWIDLTYTDRFYDPEEVKSGYGDGKQVAYLKLQCRGHGETPSRSQTENFISMCQNFIRGRPLEIIGVHCTHGFNRTGFLIVSYLVEKQDFSVECALQEFATCRPPGIYKRDYIQELYRRYDDIADAPDPPLRPKWCFESNTCDEDDREEQDDDNEDNGDNGDNGGADYDDDDDVGVCGDGGGTERKRHHKSGGRKKHKRFRTSKPEFMDGVTGVSPVLKRDISMELTEMARKMCGMEKQDIFPGSQPVSMDTENISMLSEAPYRVSWKADGTRYMMLIVDENKVYFIDRNNDVFEVTGLRFVRRNNLTQHITNTLLDGEMVIDKYEGKCVPRYLIYDIISLNGEDVRKCSFFPRRLQYIESEIINPRTQAIMQGKIDRSSEPFGVRAKGFFPIEMSENLLAEKFRKQLLHEPDGLIFQPSLQPYQPGRCSEVLKWKPSTLNSVDFKLKITVEEGKGLLTRKVGMLYVLGLNTPFSSMKVTKNIKGCDNKIIECKFENNGWVFMRERKDKNLPNSRETALSVCRSIENPVTQQYLLNFIAANRYIDKDQELMPPPPKIAR